MSASTAWSRSASGMTIMWFLAPPSAWQRFPCVAAVSWMYFATGVEPTKLTALMPGWCRMASTASLSPWTTWNTPSGRPASFSSSARIREAEGTRSDGFRMKQLPQASATGNIHIGTMTGKLNGVMPATTPSGWRSEWLSTRVPTFSVTSPLRSSGAPVANSTTSTPRASSPLASERTLPCSAVMTRAMRSSFSSSSRRNRIRTRARRSAGVCAHFGNASRAIRTASSTSAALASATWPAASRVAGLNTGAVRPLLPEASLPAMKCLISSAIGWSPPFCSLGSGRDLEADPLGHSPQVSVALLGVGQGVGLRRVLLGLDDQPARVAGLGHRRQRRLEVDAAVARHRVDTFHDRIEEAELFLVDAGQHVGPDVLGVDVVDPSRPLAPHLRRVVARECQVPRVVEQPHRVGRALHQPVDLAGLLDHRAHVVVERHPHAPVGHVAGELADPLEEHRPLGVGHHRAVGHRDAPVALHRARGLGPDHDLGARGLQQLEVRPHRRHLLLDRAVAQLAAVPARDELEPVLAQHRLERGGVVRELVALLDAGEAGLARLRDADLERRLPAELRHVVVAPGDRVGPDPDGAHRPCSLARRLRGPGLLVAL